MAMRSIPYEYARQHGLIKTGDLIAFTGTIVNPSNLLIMLGQLWEGGGNNDGLNQITHVGVAFYNEDHDELMLAEFTFCGFLKVGFKFSRLSDRIKQYSNDKLNKRVIWSPLRDDIREHVNLTEAQDWLDRVREGEYRYNMLGLPVAISKVLSKLLIVTVRPGASFCSEGVIRCWEQMQAIPQRRCVLSPQRTLVEERIIAHTCSPAEVCRMKHIHRWDDWPPASNGKQQPAAIITFNRPVASRV